MATKYIPFFSLLLLLLLAPTTLLGLNTDGVLLLSFKYSILSDPLSVLQTWNYEDASPCSWRGVTCSPMGVSGTSDMFRVTSLVLSDSKLLGSIPPDLGYIEHLQHLDLSNNFLNGTLPASIFANSTELQVLSLARNEISGLLPESIGSMKGLQSLNLSDNALAGKVPENLATLKNLTVVSLKGNNFSGPVPEGFASVRVLDLSSNLLSNSLPVDLGGENLRYLNLSYNKLSGPISPLFGAKIPDNSTIDLSFNNLTGTIPDSVSLVNQKTESFRGNIDLCGKPLKNPCSIPSTLSTPPNVTSIPPAIAVIPKPSDSSEPDQPNSSSSSNSLQGQSKKGLKPSTIVTIVVADFAGLAILGIVILYVYQLRKKKGTEDNTVNVTSPYGGIPPKKEQKQPKVAETIVSNPETEQRKPITWSCLPMKGEETSEATSSDSDDQTNDQLEHVSNGVQPKNFQFQAEASHQQQQKGGGKLVMVDGETELELETLLKASAYILGSSIGGSVVYKAVIEDGTAFAVRRIGDGGLERVKDFENQVRNLAKLKHQNLVKIRGFYWGDDEKLLISDFVSNGSLSSFSYRKPGSSPFHLPLEVRFKIARGLARGLAFIHDKKHVHGNIKPSNILLTSNMEPVISDFGLDRLLYGSKASSSGRIFGSQRSNPAAGDHPITGSPYAASSTSSASSLSYQAPESLKNIKSNPKWDVYSFGIILLELLTGRVLSERELGGQWTGSSEDKNRLLRLVDVAVRVDMEAKEDAILACFKLGFGCASFLPQKRPTMKEALQVIEKLPSYY